MTPHQELVERYSALEKATAMRLKTFNDAIRSESKSKHPNQDRVSYLKGKRVEVDRLLSYIRNQLTKTDLTKVDYDTVCQSYLNFSAHF